MKNEKILFRKMAGGAGEVRIVVRGEGTVLHPPADAVRLFGPGQSWGTDKLATYCTAATLLFWACENERGACLAAGDLVRLFLRGLPRRSNLVDAEEVLGMCLLAVEMAEKREIWLAKRRAENQGGPGDDR